MKHITDINNLISERERKLNAEYDEHKKRQAEIAAAAAAEAAKLQPAADQIASLRNQLNALTLKRDELSEQLRIGQHQLTSQQGIAAEFQGLAVRNFGHEHAEKNPGVFLQLLETRPHGLLALLIIPWLEKWLVEKQEALEETEAQITALAASAKAPVKG
jgi:hypothetical protein